LRNGETTPSVIAAIASLTRTTAQGSPNGFARAYLDLAPTGSTGDNNFDEDDLIEINGTDYTFKATPTLANHVDIGADFDESVTNLLAKIATDAAVTARVVGSANLYAQAAIGGEAGNAITVAATLAAGGEWCEDPDYITPTATLANGDADSVGQYIGHPCRVGDSPGPYAWYAWNGTTWDISAPTGVIENPNNPGFYLRLTVDGDGALAHEPYTLS
jgi:hypothetical protein